jgi:hypothetical protein
VEDDSTSERIAKCIDNIISRTPAVDRKHLVANFGAELYDLAEDGALNAPLLGGGSGVIQANLTHIARAGEQLAEHRQLTAPLDREFGVQAESRTHVFPPYGKTLRLFEYAGRVCHGDGVDALSLAPRNDGSGIWEEVQMEMRVDQGSRHV